MQFLERVCSILDESNVSYKKGDLANLIMKHAPDWRRVLNELQRMSVAGTIVISTDKTDSYDVLFKHLKEKDFKKMRQWVVNNIDTDASAIFRGLYDKMIDHLKPQGVPQMVLILADYQYKHAFVADHELNVVACLTEIMANVEFK